MEDIITYIESNYMLIIIIVIVLLITIIGYIADKKGYGKKPKKDKAIKENKIEIKQDSVVIPDVKEIIEKESNNDIIAQESEITNEKGNTNEDFSFEDIIIEEPKTNMELEQGLENNKTEEFDISDFTEEVQKEEPTIGDTELNINENNESEISDVEELSFDNLDNFIEDEVTGESTEETDSILSLENESITEESEEKDEFDDLFKDESLTEKIEIADAEPTGTLNIDNDFGKLLNDVNEDESESIKYDLPSIESISATDLSDDDDDIWKF